VRKGEGKWKSTQKMRTILGIERARMGRDSRLEMGKEIEKRLKHKPLTGPTNKYQPGWMEVKQLTTGDSLRSDICLENLIRLKMARHSKAGARS
jgi:hypothetical protein